MKWKAKPIPKEGDERWTLIFAWVPHRCSDGYWRWLCDLYARQEWVDYGEEAHWLSLEYSEDLIAFSPRKQGQGTK
jgi:hypothetical protein